MPQSGLTSRDRRVRRSRTVGAKIIVSLISFLACLYESLLPWSEDRRGIEPLRETRGREGGEEKKGMNHEEWASRSPRNVVRFTREMITGRFPGHASVETLPKHQVSLLLRPRLALDMLRGCAYPKQVSLLRKRVPVRPLGHEENTDVERPSVPSHALLRYPVTCDEALSADYEG